LNYEKNSKESLSKISGEYIKTIDLSNYSRGVYNLHVITDKETINKKVVLR